MKSEICSLPRDWFRTPTSGGLENDGVLALRLEDVGNGYARHVNGVWSPKPQSDNMKDATVMLAAVEAGDSKAAEQLLVLVYDELRPSFKNREHFFRASAEAMRRILIDRARRKHTQRHGGGYQRVDFDAFDVAAPAVDDQLLAVNEALDKLALEHPVQAELVKLRYFAGLTNEEVSQVLGISLSTAKNYWTFARAWLLNEMDGI